MCNEIEEALGNLAGVLNIRKPQIVYVDHVVYLLDEPSRKVAEMFLVQAEHDLLMSIKDRVSEIAFSDDDTDFVPAEAILTLDTIRTTARELVYQ